MMRAALFALGFVACTVQADTPRTPTCITVPVVSVYDGDTITVRLSLIAVGTGTATVVTRNEQVDRWPVRIRGYDTAEMRGGCAESKALAVRARDHVRQMVSEAGGFAVMCNLEFAGAARDRIVASVQIGGVPLAETLIGLGLAREHHGGEARQSWCPVQ